MISRDAYLELPLEERFVQLNPEENARAQELFVKLITFDLHSHIFGSVHFDFQYEPVRDSGVTGFFEAVPCLSEDFDEAMDLLGRYKSLVAAQPAMVNATCVGDIREAKANGHQAVFYQLEPQAIGRDLDLIEVAYGMGVRMMLLTFNTKNYLGDGCAERTDCGLSYLGLEVVERLNDLGVLIDLSHCGVQTSLDAIRHSKNPVLFNHTGARALNPRVNRLKSDALIQALAKKGGVIGISAVPNQLSSEPEQGIDTMLDHIEYVVNLVGIDHVAVGLDNTFHDQVAFHRKLAASREVDLEKAGIELAADYMYGIESPLEWRNIVRGLVSRGYGDTEIEKIVGGNALRIMSEVIG